MSNDGVIAMKDSPAYGSVVKTQYELVINIYNYSYANRINDPVYDTTTNEPTYEMTDSNPQPSSTAEYETPS